MVVQDDSYEDLERMENQIIDYTATIHFPSGCKWSRNSIIDFINWLSISTCPVEMCVGQTEDDGYVLDNNWLIQPFTSD